MSTFFGRTPALLAVLLCAACGNSTSTSTSGSGGGGGAMSTSSSSASSGTGGAMMDCELAITSASASSNIDITEFSASHAQGSEKHPQMGPWSYGFAAGESTATEVLLLNIGVGGPMLTQGMSYTIDDTSGGIVLLTINAPGAMTGEKDWTAMPGSTMTVDLITPGVVSGYRDVTFGLKDLVMVPDTALGAGNVATGTFKMTGKCKGAITDYQGP